MRKIVLLSIKPEFADKIFRGEKQYEYRRTLFACVSVKKVIVYATSPISQVVGEFEVDDIISMSKHALWKSTRNFSGITWRYFSEYFKGKTRCHAIKVKNPMRYSSPIPLCEASGLTHPPQSFAYVRQSSYNR